MFAGVGGFRAGLTRVGGFQCVGHCEIDKYAEASYRAIHDIREEERYYPDARAIDPDDLPQFDLLCGGFPCQAFSNAGRRKGFADARGTLFFEIARLAEAKRPRYLLLENVPGLLSHDHGKTFAAILSALDDLGYHVEWTVLNSKHFGVPQSRKRVFLICYLDPRCAGKILPVFGDGGKALIQVLGGSQGHRVYDPEGVACTQTAGGGGLGVKTGLYLIPPAAPFVDLSAGAPRPAVSPPAMGRQHSLPIQGNGLEYCTSRRPPKKAGKQLTQETQLIWAMLGATPGAGVWATTLPTHWRPAASRASWSAAGASAA